MQKTNFNGLNRISNKRKIQQSMPSAKRLCNLKAGAAFQVLRNKLNLKVDIGIRKLILDGKDLDKVDFSSASIDVYNSAFSIKFDDLKNQLEQITNLDFSKKNALRLFLKQIQAAINSDDYCLDEIKIESNEKLAYYNDETLDVEFYYKMVDSNEFAELRSKLILICCEFSIKDVTLVEQSILFNSQDKNKFFFTREAQDIDYFLGNRDNIKNYLVYLLGEIHDLKYSVCSREGTIWQKKSLANHMEIIEEINNADKLLLTQAQFKVWLEEQKSQGNDAALWLLARSLVAFGIGSPAELFLLGESDLIIDDEGENEDFIENINQILGWITDNYNNKHPDVIIYVYYNLITAGYVDDASQFLDRHIECLAENIYNELKDKLKPQEQKINRIKTIVLNKSLIPRVEVFKNVFELIGTGLEQSHGSLEYQKYALALFQNFDATIKDTPRRLLRAELLSYINLIYIFYMEHSKYFTNDNKLELLVPLIKILRFLSLHDNP